MARSKEWYERAIALDPGFALTRMFGFHFAQLANYGLLPANEAMPLVRSEARKALAIDPSLPEGHATLGLVAGLYDYDWQEAARRFELAMAGIPCRPRCGGTTPCPTCCQLAAPRRPSRNVHARSRKIRST